MRTFRWLSAFAFACFAQSCIGVDFAQAQGDQPQQTAAEAAASAPGVGDKAVDGELLTADGKKVQLSDYWQEGPLVVIWYRGGWCPICMRQLSGIREALPQITAAGAKVVAISPELPESARQTAETQQLDFPVLSDPANSLARRYGIVFQLDRETVERYRRFNLEKYNGDASMQLPVPVAYVINTDGVITFAYVNPDYHQRADASAIVEAISEKSSE